MSDAVGEYLASIDWAAAIVVAAVAVGVGLVLLRFLLATTSEVGSMLPGAGQAAGKAILDARGELPIDSWVCAVCRSVNTPQAEHCYRGCGRREDLARALPSATEAVAPGHNGRRNL
ncbi:MAG TPA: hypothetical protein VFI69_05970 [Candidatus Limnocylindrales bacterium]|nr:hypothetical protein [Candidatus Limnocylindrales bacterium]